MGASATGCWAFFLSGDRATLTKKTATPCFRHASAICVVREITKQRTPELPFGWIHLAYHARRGHVCNHKGIQPQPARQATWQRRMQTTVQTKMQMQVVIKLPSPIF